MLGLYTTGPLDSKRSLCAVFWSTLPRGIRGVFDAPGPCLSRMGGGTYTRGEAPSTAREFRGGPMGRERRRRARRTPRQAAQPSVQAPSMTPEAATPAAGTPSMSRAAERPRSTPPAQIRSDRVIARESAQMLTEVKRVGLVSAVCFGMLAVLVVVERLT